MEKNFSSIDPVLVVGSTGNLGKEICRQLIRLNLDVKGLVRTTSSSDKLNALKEFGVEMIEADIKDRSSLVKAFEGVKSVISTATSTMSRQEGDSIETVDGKGQINVIEAAAVAGVEKFIFISFPHSSIDFPLQKAKQDAENKLKESGMEYTILRAAYFHEIWFGPMLGFDYLNRKINMPGEGKNVISTIATKDVASFAVAALSNKAAKNATIELSNEDALTPMEIAQVFEKQFGKSFDVQHIPVEVLQAQYDNATDSMAKSFAALMINYDNGNVIDMKKTLEDFDIKPIPIQDYARKVMAEQQVIA
jgi:uncharacterized protein YbjT (DUF2867 family)